MVNALCATILGDLDLDPLPFPEDIVVGSSGAVSTALAPFSPFAYCRNWAWFWLLWQGRWATRDNLYLAPFSAILAAIRRKLGHIKVASHGPEWAWTCVVSVLTLARTWAPRTPLSLAMIGALLQLARLFLCGAVRPIAHLPTKCGGDIHNKC